MLSPTLRKELLERASKICKSRKQGYGRLVCADGSVCAEGALVTAMIQMGILRTGATVLEQPFIVTELGQRLIDDPKIEKGYGFPEIAVPDGLWTSIGLEDRWEDASGKPHRLWQLNDLKRWSLLNFAEAFERKAAAL